MTDERISRFLELYDPPLSPYLAALEREAEDSGVPVIRKLTRRLAAFFCEMKRPARILEIGTATGFSSIFLCEHSDASVTTIENYPPRIEAAKRHIRESGFENRITLLEGEAEEILAALSGPYDMIFLDAAQGQYAAFLPDLIRLMEKGSVLLVDDVLRGGEVVETHYAVTRRKRTIHRRLREFLRALTDDGRLTAVILPIEDGVAAAVKRDDGHKKGCDRENGSLLCEAEGRREDETS